MSFNQPPGQNPYGAPPPNPYLAQQPNQPNFGPPLQGAPFNPNSQQGYGQQPNYGPPAGAPWAGPGAPQGYGQSNYGPPAGNAALSASMLNDIAKSRATVTGNYPRDGEYLAVVLDESCGPKEGGVTWVTEWMPLKSTPAMGAMQFNGQLVPSGTPGATPVTPNMRGEKLSFTQQLGDQTKKNASGALKQYLLARLGISEGEFDARQSASEFAVQQGQTRETYFVGVVRELIESNRPGRGTVIRMTTSRKVNQGRRTAANKGMLYIVTNWSHVANKPEDVARRRAMLDAGVVPPVDFDANGNPVPEAPQEGQPGQGFGPPPGQQNAFAAPPQGQPFAAPQGQGQPGQQNAFAAPQGQGQQGQGFGPPPGQQNAFAAPQGQGQPFAAPQGQGQPGFGPPPGQQNAFAAPQGQPGQSGFGPPPGQNWAGSLHAPPPAQNPASSFGAPPPAGYDYAANNGAPAGPGSAAANWPGAPPTGR